MMKKHLREMPEVQMEVKEINRKNLQNKQQQKI